jgi:hypothetical protein
MGKGRIFGGFVAAVLATLVIASLVHTHFTLQGLRALGVAVSPGDAWAMARGDFSGLGPAFGAVIALALLIGFVVAALVRRALPWPRPVAYGLGGGAALLAALWLMHWSFEITPIGSARSWAGFLSLGLAGAIGGVLFALISRPRAA